MAEKSIVLELQMLASASSSDLSELLRKALIVATKLGLKDFQQWVANELNGYAEVEVPGYRVIRAEIVAENPFHGFIPFVLPDKIADAVSKISVRQSVASLQHILNDPSEKSSSLTVPFTSQQAAVLMKGQDGPALMPNRTVQKSQLAAIVEATRNRILEWSLQLEKEGILGAGLSFTDEDRRRALERTNIQIANFQGILGDVNGSVVTQELDQTIRVNDIESLCAALLKAGLPGELIPELKKAIQEDGTVPPSAKSFGAKVSAWVGKAVSFAANGTWQMGIAAAGNLTSNAISVFYGLSVPK